MWIEAPMIKTKAVRLYGKNDLRLEEFSLPEMGEDEIAARVICDSICMSTYKLVILGEEHKRAPVDLAATPAMVGHEFCAVITGVGDKWRDKYRVGDWVIMQTALNENDSLASPGFTYPYVGGDATNILIPNYVMKLGCLFRFEADAFFLGSLAEPMGCIVAAFQASYHTIHGTNTHIMGTKQDGCLAVLGGCGPMGLGTIDYALHCDAPPKLIVVTDINESLLRRAREIFTGEQGKAGGPELIFLNGGREDIKEALLEHAPDGYDDVFTMVPAAPVVELADSILGRDGCHNFFAGPTDLGFSARINWFNVHYGATHVVGTSGGTVRSILDSVELMKLGRINPAVMITHIGGLDAVVDTTLNLPKIPGGKKLIYTQIDFPLTAISDLAEKGRTDPLCRRLGKIVAANNMLWCPEAEHVLLEALS
jgi:threonine dehydrogenase-like Zn-dependent dehydrogenase